MNIKIKKVISFIIASIIFTLNVFATGINNKGKIININSEENNVLDRYNAEQENDIEIQVIKKIGEDEILIYSGLLSGYQDRELRSSDFSKIEYLATLNWEGEEPEVLYIIPKDNNRRNADKLMSADELLSRMGGVRATSSNAKFDLDAVFWNNNGYDECISEKNSLLGVDLKIKNNSGSTETIQPYFAIYENGKLIQAKMLSSKTVRTGNEVEYTESMNINSNNAKNYTAKVFNWTSESFKPLSKTISISADKADFYSNSRTDATVIKDYEKEIKGTINASNDIDYIKIIPATTKKYSLKTFSISDVKATLYNSSGSVLAKNFTSLNYTLTANKTYYVKFSNSGAIGDYIFKICKELSDEAENFNVYEFDADVTVYKNSILDICNELYYDNEDLSKQLYSEYEDVLDEDVKLHILPAFMLEHPKDISDFDDLLSSYYGTKYDKFKEIRQKYIDLIDKYTTQNYLPDTEDPGVMGGEDEASVPVIEKFVTPAIEMSTEETLPEEQTRQTKATPSFTIVNTTETTITYNATFPVSGKWGNTIYLVDFNKSNGLTSCYNAHENDEKRTNGQYTITGLDPGGIYIVAMMWSTDGRMFGGENSINRFVQLPDNTAESLTLYSGDRVTARIEASDKELASDEDFEKWLDRMDATYYAYKELTGYTPYNSKKIEMRSTMDNLNDFFDITDGYNYWEIILGYYDYTNVFKHSRAFNQGHMRRLSRDDWGETPMHELSHVFDRDVWTFDAETLSQFKLYYVVEQLNAKTYSPGRYNNDGKGWYTSKNYYELLKYDRYMDCYNDTFNVGSYSSEGFAVILIDIQKKIGWEPFKKTFRFFSSLSPSQELYNEGEILKLFLTKLKDYSGEDVLEIINSRDTKIIENWYGITLEYSDPIYPIISSGGASGGSSQIIVEKDNYSIFQFTPKESANYYIYTSPYGGSGVSNDTYIEVYNNSSLSGTPLATNDDYDGGRFSKVNVAMTEDTTYYIKVRHYSGGQLHAELNITKDIPILQLSLDEYEDIGVARGEFALYSYTPTKSITHVFEVEGYNGEATADDTYIKLYGNESLTERVANHNNKIIVNLIAGHTYYLQFCGFLMKSAYGRISVREGQTIEFSKSTDGSFIYVNSPEYITRFDIVDDMENKKKIKLFEEENISGKNTYYQTHISWWGHNPRIYEPIGSFYVDIDFYNPTDENLMVSVSNLAYGTEYSVIENYYSGGGTSVDIIIPAQEHRLLFETLNAPLELSYPGESNGDGWSWSRHRSPVILFDFEVSEENVVVSSLAAYSRNNLRLKNGYNNMLDSSEESVESGEIIYDLESRTNEDDLAGKYKGIAKNESAWIDANIDLAIDENTELGSKIPLYLKDDYYNYGIANPKWSWKTSISPMNDRWDGVLKALPNGLHNFKYHHGTNGEAWHFDFLHRNLRYINLNSTTSINDEVPSDIVENVKLDVASGLKNHFPDEYNPNTGENLGNSPDEYSISMGEWGATYHYTVTVNNTTDDDRVIYINTWNVENLIFGLKNQGEREYTTQYYSQIQNDAETPEKTAIVSLPKNEVTTFEFVTLLGGGLAGINHSIVIE